MIAGYLDTLRAANHNARLVLMISVIMGFTIDGGIYAAILNLYILRLSFGPEFVGQINSVANLVFALGSLAAGWLGSRFGDRRIMIVGLFLATAARWTVPMTDTLAAAQLATLPGWVPALSFTLPTSGSVALLRELPRPLPDCQAHAEPARGNVFAFAVGAQASMASLCRRPARRA